MFRLGFTALSAAALLSFVAPFGTARAAAPAASPSAPPGLLGAWGDDSSCSADVAIFRADGTVSLPEVGPDVPETTYSVNGPSITFTQGTHTGTFAFALNDVAVAWSNGSNLVLKARCADQSAFASGAGRTPRLPATPAGAAQAAASAAEAQASLFDQIKVLAAAPLLYNGVRIKVRSVSAVPASAQPASGPIYSAVTATPDPAAVGTGGALFYRIFPTEAAAAAYVSLARESDVNFIHDERAAGSFATASAVDHGPAGSKAAPVTIHCLRLHPGGQDAVRISCFAHLPGSPLVAGGAQSFPLAKGAAAKDVGSQADLAETLDLTGLAIDQLRAFLSGNHPN